jgi:LPS export ABC transporter protein LptC
MKKILMVVLSILFLSTLFVMLRNGREMSGDMKMKGNSFIEKLRIVHKKNGVTVWTLNARKADFLEGEDEAKLSDISMVIQKNGMVLYADKGLYNLSGRSFTTDEVVKAQGKDFTIKADSIDYDVSSGRIKSEGRVEVDSKKFKVEGKGMKADEGKKVTILDDVKATFYE